MKAIINKKDKKIELNFIKMKESEKEIIIWEKENKVSRIQKSEIESIFIEVKK